MPLADLAAAELAYAQRGWAVVSLHTSDRGGRCSCGKRECANSGKHPRWHSALLPDGLLSATCDAARIQQWRRHWPAANIGLRTGSTSGLLVLDVDPRHEGDATLADLERRYDPLPATARSLTGGGGEHYLFRHPGGAWPNSALGPGLDTRGDGGYIVAPPSLHASGRCYAWDLDAHPDDVPLVSPPAWLLQVWRGTTARPAAGVGRRESTPETLPAGERNTVLASLAGALRRRGLEPPEILPCLEAVNRRRCRPPLDRAELTQIADGMGRYAPAAPLASPRSRTGMLGGVPV